MSDHTLIVVMNLVAAAGNVWFVVCRPARRWNGMHGVVITGNVLALLLLWAWTR